MKCDIVMLSKTCSLVERALHSISKFVDAKAIGKVLVGWTGSPFDASFKQDWPGFRATGIYLTSYNFAANNNFIASNFCTSEAVLFMNDDVELVEDSVSKCLSILGSHSDEIGTVGIKLLYPNGTIQHKGQFVAFQHGHFAGVGHIGWKQADLCPMSEHAAVVAGNTGAFLMVKRSDFLSIGGFDESFKHSLEDVKLNLQLLEAGKKNVCDSTTWAWHTESQTRKQASCKEDMQHLAMYIEQHKASIFGANI